MCQIIYNIGIQSIVDLFWQQFHCPSWAGQLQTKCQCLHNNNIEEAIWWEWHGYILFSLWLAGSQGWYEVPLLDIPIRHLVLPYMHSDVYKFPSYAYNMYYRLYICLKFHCAPDLKEYKYVHSKAYFVHSNCPYSHEHYWEERKYLKSYCSLANTLGIWIFFQSVNDILLPSLSGTRSQEETLWWTARCWDI